MPIDVTGNKRENEGSSKIARMAARKMFLDASSSSSNSIKLTSQQDRVVLVNFQTFVDQRADSFC